MRLRAAFGALIGTLALLATAGHPTIGRRAAGNLVVPAMPLLPGSALPIVIDGFVGAYHVAVLGAGDTRGGIYRIPDSSAPGAATLIAGNRFGVALARVGIAAPPTAASLLVVASYDDGLVFHAARTFAPLGLLALAGAPSDVAALDGRILATDTQGNALAIVSRAPWTTAQLPGVPFGDAIAIDPRNGDAFVTERGTGSGGWLARVTRSGIVTKVATGDTPEGVAIDARRGRIYVANTNDGSVAVVDARTMRVVQRIDAVARVFSLALSPDGTRLFAVSNQSFDSPFGRSGGVVAIALGAHPRVVRRSAPLTFPLGVALDAEHHRLFVTDEARNTVDVLDARSLRRQHAPLPTCTTPWKPTFDPLSDRLYIPCARADRIDVFNGATLRRVAGAPFATAGYPLAVAVVR